MKKQVILLSRLMIAAMVVLSGACSDKGGDEPEPTPNPPAPKAVLALVENTWTLPRNEASYDVGVLSNVAWKATTESSWLTLKNTEGTGNGSFTLVLPENATNEARSADITVKSTEDASLLATFKITQEATVFNVSSQDAVTVPAEGNTITVDVEGNIDYTFKMSEWTRIEAAPGTVTSAFCALTKSKIIVSIAPNEAEASRECDLIILNGEKEVKRIHITQTGKVIMPETPVMTVVVNGTAPDADIPVRMGCEGGLVRFMITANVAYDYEESDWINPNGGFSEAVENTMLMHVAPNFTGVTRDKLFVFKAQDETVEDVTVRLRQDPVDDLMFIVKNDYFDYTGGDAPLTIQTTNEALKDVIKCQIILPEDSPIEVVGGNAVLGENILRLNEKNLSTDVEGKSYGTVEVRILAKNFGGGYLSRVLPLHQLPAPVLAFSGDRFFDVGADAGSSTFKVRNIPEGEELVTKVIKVVAVNDGGEVPRIISTDTLQNLPSGGFDLQRDGDKFTVIYPANTSDKYLQHTYVYIYVKSNPKNACTGIVMQGVAFQAKASILLEADVPLQAAATTYESKYAISFQMNKPTADNNWEQTSMPFVKCEVLSATDNFITTDGIVVLDAKFRDGDMGLKFNFLPNTGAVPRTAMIKIQVFKKEGDTKVLAEKTVTLEQAAAE